MAGRKNKLYVGSVYDVEDLKDGTVLFTDTGRISAGDGRLTDKNPDLAGVRTQTTVAMLGYLKANGVPGTLISQETPTVLRMVKCTMLKGEFIARRWAGDGSSYLQRNPDLSPGKLPQLVTEIFHKMTLDRRDAHRPVLVDGNALRQAYAKAQGSWEAGMAAMQADIQAGLVFADPYLEYDDGLRQQWHLFDAHAPVSETTPALFTEQPQISYPVFKKCVALLGKEFYALERGLAKIKPALVHRPGMTHVVLADMKAEYGIGPDGALYRADVANLDTIRLLVNGETGKDAQLSKQVYRNGKNMATVLEVYDHGWKVMKQLAA